ncbi:MAG: LamB/YcsF family protein [Clostridiales bacterium]|nr:LamB/YcsF family protein [Clostridiales bacterium]
MYKIDLNCDLGESFGAYKIGLDDKILPFISSANVACGFHASDPLVMSETVKNAAKSGAAVGAHPGFPDLMGFGRRNMNVSAAEAKAYISYQIGALDAFCRANGVKLRHIKPHGALYNMAAKERSLADAICEAVYEYDNSLILLGLSGSMLLEAAKAKGLPYASEVFADRAYEEDGSLVARTKEGAVIKDEDEAVNRVIRMVTQGTVEAITGKVVPIKADSVCVHGDNEKALAFVMKIRASLESSGVKISA